MLIKHAKIFTGPGPEFMGDILIKDGVVIAVDHSVEASDSEIIEAAGLVAAPGLIDLHVHLRDPGQTEKEDILSGTAAAAAGGVTTVVAMPNTNPPVSSPEQLAYVYEKAGAASARVLQSVTITEGMLGERLCDFEALKAAGAAAATDDGRPVENSALMLEAMRECARIGLPVMSHSEELSLAAGGLINEGDVSRALGVKGIPQAAEDIAVARECMLSLYESLPVHICHVSSRYALECIRMAKALGAPITCETAPHYFSLNHKELLGRDADFRMNPPLRAEEDVHAIIAAIADGTIDAIATDHAPHTSKQKACFETAPNGVIGLETSLAAGITYLVNPGHITLARLIELQSTAPAEIMGIASGRIEAGAAADIVLFDPAAEFTVDVSKLHGKSVNTPYKNKSLCGQVKQTLLNGHTVYKLEE